MRIDRTLQYKILSDLDREYPKSITLIDDDYYQQIDEHKLVANLVYLEQHGLIEGSVSISTDGFYSFEPSEITYKGIDFLKDDGGISAILNTVTVKLETETLRQIFEEKINRADLSPADKQKWLDELRGLPAESIKHLTTKALDVGFDSLPTLFQLIQSGF